MEQLMHHSPFGMAVLNLKRKVIESNSIFKSHINCKKKIKLTELQKKLLSDKRELKVYADGYVLFLKSNEENIYAYTFDTSLAQNKLLHIRHDIKSTISPIHGLVQLLDTTYENLMIDALNKVVHYVDNEIVIEKLT